MASLNGIIVDSVMDEAGTSRNLNWKVELGNIGYIWRTKMVHSRYEGYDDGRDVRPLTLYP